MKLFIGTKQQVTPRTCMGAKNLFGILLLPLLFIFATISLRAQPEWQINGNNPSSGQPILGTLYNSQNPQPLRFYANGNQRGIFSQYSGYLGIGINAPKNPLHIHSNDTRANCTEFDYNDPEDPIIGNDMNGNGSNPTSTRSASSITSPDYSGLQITNNATGANPENGLLMYVHGHQGFLRHLEDELFTIGVREHDIMNFTPAGNVGIGTDQPAQMLHVVNGNILISRTSNMNSPAVGNRAPGSRNGSLLFGDVIDANTQYGNWGIEYVNDPNDPGQGQGLNFWQPCGANQLTANYRLFLADNGNIGIKTNNPQAELAVNGTVLAKAVRVNISATYWPDYVFGNDYKMMTISELESYVNENRHLPGIPSASEVEEEGSVDLGEMNTILLQKVEELTRYIIDLQKQIDELKKGKGVKE